MTGVRDRHRWARTTLVAALGALACCLLAARASAYVYWANEGTGSIGRASLDGSGVEARFVGGAGDPQAVAVDGSHVYWTNFAGTIGRADLDGRRADPSLIDLAASPFGVAVDAEHIYWSQAAIGTIGRADLDGQNVEESFITGADSPVGLAVDAEHLYWSNQAAGTIGRANLNGTGVDQGFIAGAGEPQALAVDAFHLYWANSSGGAIGRANLDGTEVDPGFIDGVDEPRGVALDSEHVYWGDDAATTIGRANRDGTGTVPSFIEGVDSPLGLVVDGLRNTTATGLACTPAAPTLPGSVTCTATVTDTADVGALAPLGIVHFGSNGAGAFAPTIRCSLFAIAAARSACQLTYVPLAPGEQTITADYAGYAERHTSSRGDATLEVLVQPPAPSGGGAMPEAKPDNAFTLAGPKLNRRRGTATIAASVPAAGRLLLAGNGVRRARRSAAGPGSVRLAVRPNRRSWRRLARRGMAKVEAEVTYTPAGGDPNTRLRRLTLRLRPR